MITQFHLKIIIRCPALVLIQWRILFHRIYILGEFGDSRVFEGIISDQRQSCKLCDMKIRMKVTPTPPNQYDDPSVVEFTFTSALSNNQRMHFPSAYIKGKRCIIAYRYLNHDA